MNTLTLIGTVRTAETDGKPYLLVGTTCPQRPDLSTRYGIGLKITHNGLADRLIRAINAGKVFSDLEILVDVHGAEYISSTCMINTRVMNASLKRIGF
jgi:hypothetical protein